MISIENYIFNYVSSALLLSYSNLKVRNEYVASQASFPLCTIEEMDNSVVTGARTTTIENAVSVTYDVNVYAKTKAEAKQIMESADSKMAELGFTRMSLNRTPNLLESTIYRLTARYEAVIDKETVTEQGSTVDKHIIYQGA